jgi:hypothetical protein
MDSVPCSIDTFYAVALKAWIVDVAVDKIPTRTVLFMEHQSEQEALAARAGVIEEVKGYVNVVYEKYGFKVV